MSNDKDHLGSNNMFPAKITNILMNWLVENYKYPYPDENEKLRLCRETGLSKKQLMSWLTDARRVSLLFLL